MFKKFLIIGLLIPAYSFSLDPEELMLAQQREQRLINTINARYSDRNTHCALGACSGGLGGLLFAAFESRRLRRITPPDLGLFCLASVCCSCYSFAKVIAMQCRIDRDSQVLSKVQIDLHRQIVSAMSSLPLHEESLSNNASRGSEA